jgi:hypothetical protein
MENKPRKPSQNHDFFFSFSKQDINADIEVEPLSLAHQRDRLCICGLYPHIHSPPTAKPPRKSGFG